MPMNDAPVYRANGTIAPASFAAADTSGPNLAVQAINGSLPIIGVVGDPQKRAPGLAGSDSAVAAELGDAVRIYSLGQVCTITLAGSVIAGQLLMPGNSAGGAVTATSGNYYGARATQSGGSGARVQCQVEFGKLP